MTNIADPDQLASEGPTDLDLHCLLKHSMSCFTREGLSAMQIVADNIRGMYIYSVVFAFPLRDSNSVRIACACLPFEKACTIKGIAPPGSNFLILEWIPF